MAFNIELQVSVPTLVTQTTSYTLPPSLVYLTSNASVDISVDGTNWNALTNSSTIGAYTSATFVRCTTSTTCQIIVKKF